ncbi:MAG: aspartate 1-decarboxylase [Opitutales bacterium]|nr:aspartate 1-decarboxylase [Opitutales bacterium]
MLVQILKSKILRAEATDAVQDYEGSLAVDENLMKTVGLLYGEKILVGNITNGKRFETYAIPAPAGSKTFSLRGAAAHMGKPGDKLVIMSFAQLTEDEAKTWIPRTITLAEGNSKIIKAQNPVKI